VIQINVVAVGRIKEKFLREGIDEYAKRLSPLVRLRVKETREEPFPANFSAAQKEQLLLKEGRRLINLANGDGYPIALDVDGETLSSPELAGCITSLANTGEKITFLIGGPLGISNEVKSFDKRRLSFSALTFTHQMARLILFEQIYRAIKISRGEKYHW